MKKILIFLFNINILILHTSVFAQRIKHQKIATQSEITQMLNQDYHVKYFIVGKGNLVVLDKQQLAKITIQGTGQMVIGNTLYTVMEDLIK